MLLDFKLKELISDVTFFVAEADLTTMQQVNLWFCAALSVVFLGTSFVDGQEVILLSDPDFSPVGQVSKSLIFTLY